MSNPLTNIKNVLDFINNLRGSQISQNHIAFLQDRIATAEKDISNLQQSLAKCQLEKKQLQMENEEYRQEIRDHKPQPKPESLYKPYKTSGGSLVFQSIEDANQLICPVCFKRNHMESFLQPFEPFPGENIFKGVIHCPVCDTEFKK